MITINAFAFLAVVFHTDNIMYKPLFAASCGGKETAILSCGSTSGNGLMDLLIVFVNFLALAVGIAVLLGIVFGAILYTSAGGSADQAKRGIGYIRNAIIALLLFIFMYAIINFLVPGGLFG